MNNLPNEVFTSNQVKLIERDHANNHNGHCFDLMQSAGQAVFDYIVQNRPETREIFIFCGKGNNGGDGYIVANLMLQHNINHRVFATGVPHEGSEASIAYEYYSTRRILDLSLAIRITNCWTIYQILNMTLFTGGLFAYMIMLAEIEALHIPKSVWLIAVVILACVWSIKTIQPFVRKEKYFILFNVFFR